MKEYTPIKQHITVDQLKELSPKQLDLFADVLNFHPFTGIKSDAWLEDFAYYCNIGILMEFLFNHGEYIIVTNCKNGDIEKLKIILPDYNSYIETMLVDSLWESVKSKLERLV